MTTLPTSMTYCLLHRETMRFGTWRDQEMVVLSKDADFAVRALKERTVQVVWVRCGNLMLKALEAWFVARMLTMRRLLDAGEYLVELR